MQGWARREQSRLGRVTGPLRQRGAYGTLRAVDREQTGSGAGGRDRVALALLAAALVVGLLRFVRLGEWSLWIDEALTLSDALHGKGADNPLGYWLLGLVAEARGGRPDEWALRIVPALFGYLSIPLSVWALRPIAGLRAASAGALIVSASSWHVYWSQNARFYTLAAFLTLLGAGLVLRGLARGRVAPALAGLAVAGSSALAHPTALLVPAALVAAPLVLLLLGRGLDRRVTLAMGLVGLLALFLLVGWASGLVVHWQDVRGSGNPAHFLLTAGFHLTPWLLAGGGLGALWALRTGHRGLQALAVVVALGLGLALATSFGARMTAQYVFAFLPWLAVLAAAPLATADGLARGGVSRPVGARAVADGWLQLATVALLVVPALVSTGLYLTVRHGERWRWREAYAHVFENRRPGDMIFGMAAPVGEYYLTARRSEVRDPVELVYLDRFRSEVPGRWDRRGRRAWFVVNEEDLYDWAPAQRAQMRRILREDCRLVASFPLEVESRDLSVLVYLRE